jgi:proliferating cell nuclear antigen PCNA
MEIVLYPSQKADVFAALFQHIKLLTDHVNLTFEPTRMYMQCMDNAHVAILELYLPAKWFDRYELTGTGSTITIGLNASFLYRILSAREKDQQIHIVYSDADRLLVHLTNMGETKTNFDKHFELPLMDIDSETMEIPAIEYSAELSISSSHFAGIINQLKMFGDTMDIQCSEDRIVLASNSQDQGKMFVEINIDDISAFAIDEGSKLNLSFSLGYLHHFCMYHKLTKEVELKFSESYPMQVVYSLVNVGTTTTTPSVNVGTTTPSVNVGTTTPSVNVGTTTPIDDPLDAKLVFYLAPKINDD